jgi:hypothetical protein
MKRLLAILCVLGGTPLALAAEAPKQPGADALTPLMEKGALQEVRKLLEQVFAFTVDGERLKLDRLRWAQAMKDAPDADALDNSPIDALFWKIGDTTGTGDDGSSTSNARRTLHFSGGKVAGRLDVEGDVLKLTLEENAAPNRRLTLRDDGRGGLALQLLHPEGSVILLTQTRGGQCTLVAVLGDQVRSGRGDTFAACFRKHRKEFETHVQPALAHHGIQLFLPTQTPQVRQGVLAILARTPETLAQGRQLLDELDSKDFAVREKASQRLSERFLVYENQIRQKLQDKPSLELQRRLEKILQEHRYAPRVHQTVATLDLLHDAAYLVSLLDGAKAEDGARLVAELEKITGQKLGTDPAAWKEWVRRNLK